MGTNLQVTSAAPDENGWTRSQIDLIKATVAKDTTDEELQLFLMIAKRTGLDPFARQVYCIRRFDRTLNRKVATIQTSIDGYRLLADRTGRYAPGRETVFYYDMEAKGEDVARLISATVYIKKHIQGEWHEIAATAYFDEYAQESPLWKRMPRVMLAKCAESLALRRAFPAELSGIYTSDEMGADTPLQEARPVVDVEVPPVHRLHAAPARDDAPPVDEPAAWSKLGDELDKMKEKAAAHGVTFDDDAPTADTRETLELEIVLLTKKLGFKPHALTRWILKNYEAPGGFDGLFLYYTSDKTLGADAYVDELVKIRDQFSAEVDAFEAAQD